MKYAPHVFYAALLLAWALVPGALGVPKYIFPSLQVVLREFGTSGSLIISNTMTTALEAAMGVAIGCLFGFLVGLSMGASTTFERITMPIVIGSNAVPIVAIAPLIVLWVGHGILSKVIVAAFLSFFPIALNTFDGLRPRSTVSRDLFFVLGATSSQHFLKYRLPHAVPAILTGLKISGVLAVIGAVVSEFIGSDSGLGFGMLQARYSLNTPRLFCYTIASCFLGLLVYYLLHSVERGVLSSRRWRGASALH